MNFFHMIIDFSQILFCNQTTDIRKFFDDFNAEESVDRCIIFHPEFLNETNSNLLNEKFHMRLSSICHQRGKNILVISSKSFTSHSKYFTSFSSEEIAYMRENSIKGASSRITAEFNKFPAKQRQNDFNEFFIDKENPHLRFRNQRGI